MIDTIKNQMEERRPEISLYGFMTGQPVEVVIVGPYRGLRGRVSDFQKLLVQVALDDPGAESPQIVWVCPWHIMPI